MSFWHCPVPHPEPDCFADHCQFWFSKCISRYLQGRLQIDPGYKTNLIQFAINSLMTKNSSMRKGDRLVSTFIILMSQ